MFFCSHSFTLSMLYSDVITAVRSSISAAGIFTFNSTSKFFISSFVSEAEPVSYTHLDVYKRQVYVFQFFVVCSGHVVACVCEGYHTFQQCMWGVYLVLALVYVIWGEKLYGVRRPLKKALRKALGFPRIS